MWKKKNKGKYCEKKKDKLQRQQMRKRMDVVSGCTTSISLAFLTLYIIYAKLNLLRFLLSLAHPLSYLFIDLSSKALL